MIIPESPKSSLPDVRSSDTSRLESEAPPPYYDGTSNHQRPVKPLPIQSHHVQPLPVNSYPTESYPTQQPNYRRAARRRFFRAFAVAVLVWFLISMLVRTFVMLIHRGHRQRKAPSDWEASIPADVEADHCVHSNGWLIGAHGMKLPADQTTAGSQSLPYWANTSFELPLSSDLLFLLARGSQSRGSLDIVSSPEVTDVVKINMSMRYLREDIRGRASVCLIRREGESGIGIFTPFWERDYREKNDNTYFVITVILPASSGDTPLRINKLETDLPNYEHNIGDLEDTVHFRKISLRGSNMPISVGSLYADKARFRTSNAAIHGSFNTLRYLSLMTSNAPINGFFNSSSLTLATSNAPITATIGLNNDRETPPTKLILSTVNGFIDSNISLFTPHSTGGHFKVEAITKNSPLNISFLASPVDSVLNLNAKTTNSPATVSLHSAYEGSFGLFTSLFRPSVMQRSVEDPSGKGRRRIVETSNSRLGSAKGYVTWSRGSKRSRMAVVTVESTLSPVHLKL